MAAEDILKAEIPRLEVDAPDRRSAGILLLHDFRRAALSDPAVSLKAGEIEPVRL